MKSLNLAATALTMSFIAGAALAQPATMGTNVKTDANISDKQAQIGADISTTTVSTTTTHETKAHGEHKADHKMDHKSKKEAK